MSDVRLAGVPAFGSAWRGALARWLTGDAGLAVALFVVGVVSRLPFRSQLLYHWDSVNFSLAMRQFDLAADQPQPPGYILYVWLCRLVDLLFHDPQTTMVVISIAAGGLAAAALFYLGRALFDRRVGAAAGLLLASSPLFWFYGEIALPHALDALLVIASIGCLYAVMRGDVRWLAPSVVALSLAGGVRQQTLVFLAPAALVAFRRLKWRQLLFALGLGAALCLAWFVPLMAASGGLARYLAITGAFSARFQSTTSLFMGAGLWGLRRNALKLGMYTLYGLGAALLPLGAVAVGWAAGRLRIHRREKVAFLAAWILPAGLFYTLVHMGQQGLVFVFLPALLLVGAWGLVRIVPARWGLGLALLVALNAATFLALPEYPLGQSSLRLLTRATLANSDRYFFARFAALRTDFSPADTVILAANWHHLQYYLPGYRIVPFNVGAKWEVDAGVPEGTASLSADASELGLHIDPGAAARVVLFDPEILPFDRSPGAAQALPLTGGGSLEYRDLPSGARLVVTPASYAVAGP